MSEATITAITPPAQGDTMSPQQLTQKIGLQLNIVGDGIAKLVAYVEEAREREVWSDLGYDSWAAYVEAEFGDALKVLNDRARRALVPALDLKRKDAAAIFGTTERTIQRDRNPKPAQAPKVEEAQEGDIVSPCLTLVEAPEVVEAQESNLEDCYSALEDILGRMWNIANEEGREREVLSAIHEKADLVFGVKIMTKLGARRVRA